MKAGCLIGIVCALALSAVCDETVRYRKTGLRAALDNAVSAAEKTLQGTECTPKEAQELLELSRYVDSGTRIRYRAFAEKSLVRLKETKANDPFVKKAADELSDLKRLDDELQPIANALPPAPMLPVDEYRYRFRFFWNAPKAYDVPGRNCRQCPSSYNKIFGGYGKLDMDEVERMLVAAIPDAPDDLYLEYSRNGNRLNYEKCWLSRERLFEMFASAEIAEGKGRFIPKIVEMLETFCAQRSWVFPAHDVMEPGWNGNFRGTSQSVDLFSSELAANIACGIDRLRTKLPAHIIERVKSEMERRIFAPIRRELRFHPSQGAVSGAEDCAVFQSWIDRASNWNAVCWDNVVCAALAMLDDPADRAYFVNGAMKSVDFYLFGFSDDGYCSEGMGYWNYGFGHHVLMGRLLKIESGGKLDIFTRQIQRKIASYAKNYELAPGICPAFADGNGDPSQLILGLMREIWPESVRSPDAVTVFPKGQVWLFRAKSGLSVAFKGGHNGEQHNHNDVGSYYVVNNGRFVTGDPGHEQYTRRTFSSHRYDSPIINSYGHPVPTVGGALQKTGAQYRAQVVAQELGRDRCSVSLELKDVYGVNTLKSLVRTFVWDISGKTFTVRDRFSFTEPTLFEDPYLAYGDATCAPEISVVPAGYSLKEEDIPNPHHNAPRRIAVVPSAPVMETEVAFTFRSAPCAPSL